MCTCDDSSLTVEAISFNSSLDRDGSFGGDGDSETGPDQRSRTLAIMTQAADGRKRAKRALDQIKYE
jgi:hypothetical protein